MHQHHYRERVLCHLKRDQIDGLQYDHWMPISQRLSYHGNCPWQRQFSLDWLLNLSPDRPIYDKASLLFPQLQRPNSSPKPYQIQKDDKAFLQNHPVYYYKMPWMLMLISRLALLKRVQFVDGSVLD